MVNGQGLVIQLICHTKPYNNHNFQIDGASRYLVYDSDYWSTYEAVKREKIDKRWQNLWDQGTFDQPCWTMLDVVEESLIFI